jgi:hypothetical protein
MKGDCTKADAGTPLVLSPRGTGGRDETCPVSTGRRGETCPVSTGGLYLALEHDLERSECGGDRFRALLDLERRRLLACHLVRHLHRGAPSARCARAAARLRRGARADLLVGDDGRERLGAQEVIEVPAVDHHHLVGLADSLHGGLEENLRGPRRRPAVRAAAASRRAVRGGGGRR